MAELGEARLNIHVDSAPVRRDLMLRVLGEDVLDEVARQDVKWGLQEHPSGTGGALYERLAVDAREECQDAAKEGTLTWVDILREELYEALAESDPAKLDRELCQVEAVVRNWRSQLQREHGGLVDRDTVVEPTDDEAARVTAHHQGRLHGICVHGNPRGGCDLA